MHTTAEVAEAFGVTQERVRQIEAKFLALLRHPMFVGEDILARPHSPRSTNRLSARR
jgi:hypothetical protein